MVEQTSDCKLGHPSISWVGWQGLPATGKPSSEMWLFLQGELYTLCVRKFFFCAECAKTKLPLDTGFLSHNLGANCVHFRWLWFNVQLFLMLSVIISPNDNQLSVNVTDIRQMKRVWHVLLYWSPLGESIVKLTAAHRYLCNIWSIKKL